jgi:hypothetical protein
MQYQIATAIAFAATSAIAANQLVVPLLADIGQHIEGTIFPALESFL